MAVTVYFFFILEQVTGTRSKVVEINGTVKDLLAKLIDEYGEEFAKLVFDSEKSEILPGISLSVNGGDVRTLNGLDTPVKSGDEVAFLPIAAGG